MRVYSHAQLVTTMIYLDIITVEKAKAMATLESEKDKKIAKKLKNANGTLSNWRIQNIYKKQVV